MLFAFEAGAAVLHMRGVAIWKPHQVFVSDTLEEVAPPYPEGLDGAGTVFRFELGRLVVAGRGQADYA